MPARNAASTIGESLASLLVQQWTDFEVVLVDDGSNDGTSEVAHRVWGPDPRLRILRPGATGLVQALQLGLQMCRGTLVARFDADDIALPERLQMQVDYFLAHPEIHIVGCWVESFAEGGIAEGYRLYDAWINGLCDHAGMAREMFVESPLAHPSVMFRRDAILELGGYRDSGWPEDYDLWLRAHLAGLRFGKVEKMLLRWRDHSGRTSRLHARYTQDAFLRCKAHYLAKGPLRAHERVIIWGAGAVGRRLALHLRHEGVLTHAFVDIDPRKVGRDRGGIPTHPMEHLHQLRGHFLLSAVGSRGARGRIRSFAESVGFREGFDFLCAA